MSDALIATHAETRTVYMGSDIEAAATFELVMAFITLQESDPTKPVRLILNSVGGDLNQGLAICDLIKAMPFKITGIVLGECYSSAAMILQACDRREMLPASSFMIHEGTTGVRSKYHGEAVTEMKEYDRLHHKMVGILAKASSNSEEVISKLISKGRYFTAEEALEHGFIDKIIKTL